MGISSSHTIQQRDEQLQRHPMCAHIRHEEIRERGILRTREDFPAAEPVSPAVNDTQSAGIRIARASAMETTQLPRTCRWSMPTLFTPLWLDAWTMEWTCGRDGTLRLLEQADCCRACPRWEDRSTAPVDNRAAKR
jgi:hypothetical protein